jgi:hypothetical protein
MARKRKYHPTHRVMFGDDIRNVAQGWRYASVIKTGTKWVYFVLFEGTGAVYKAAIPKWKSLTKYECDKKGRRIET